jgi:hypothetical protein
MSSSGISRELLRDDLSPACSDIADGHASGLVASRLAHANNTRKATSQKVVLITLMQKILKATCIWALVALKGSCALPPISSIRAGLATSVMMNTLPLPPFSEMDCFFLPEKHPSDRIRNSAVPSTYCKGSDISLPHCITS